MVAKLAQPQMAHLPNFGAGRCRLWALSCLTLVLLVTVQAIRPAAQSPAAAAKSSPDPVPVFRAATRLVQVSVVVHDRHGQPVKDLKKEDFALTESGKPQQISFFAVDSAETPTPPPAALPPHIFTNILPRHAGVPTSVTAILLALLNP